MSEEKVPKKLSLYKILRHMADFDDDSSDLSQEDFEEIVGTLPDKVDSCKDFIDSTEGRIAVLQRQIDDLKSTKDSLSNTIKNFKKYLDFTMSNLEVNKLQGDKYSLSRSERKTIDFVPNQITTEMFIELNIQKANTIERNFKLNKTNFKQLCSSHPDLLAKYGKESVNSFVQFRAKKGV